jgi:hypothetical protein
VDHLQERLERLEQRTHTVERQLRWWRGMACGFLLLGLLTWALPLGRAQYSQGDLEQRVADLEYKLEYVSGGDNEVVITGANLRIVNGLGSTTCTNAQGGPIPDCPNGLGNLIVGYNEPRGEGGENIRTGSHNVVVGSQHNFSRFGGLVVGFANNISGEFAAVSGGNNNTASGDVSSVSGGDSNTASGDRSSVSGGGGNTAGGPSSAVSGGILNTASGEFAAVSGGNVNTASGVASTVSGGRNRTAAGNVDWVAGPLFADD